MLDPSAEAAMRDQIGGALRTQAVYVAAKLGIADQLSLGPRTAGDLASVVNAHAATLRRVLRFLASRGVFTELEDGRFALSSAAEYLQTAHPRSLRKSAIRAGEGMWNVSNHLLAAVRSGETPYELFHQVKYFDRKQGDAEREFAARMTTTSAGLGAAIARNNLFATARHVVDVGGGHGAVLLPILAAHDHLEGTLFDRASTIENARHVIAQSEVAARCALVAGDFFVDVPAGDVHILSWILHDWKDEEAICILRKCRKAAMGTAARILIIETLMAPRAVAASSRDRASLSDPFALDMQMLLLTGGVERTLEEYRAILDEAGYELGDVSSTGGSRGASLLVARTRNEK
jgi:hypothetical protein